MRQPLNTTQLPCSARSQQQESYTTIEGTSFNIYSTLPKENRGAKIKHHTVITEWPCFSRRKATKTDFLEILNQNYIHSSSCECLSQIYGSSRHQCPNHNEQICAISSHEFPAAAIWQAHLLYYRYAQSSRKALRKEQFRSHPVILSF